MLSKNFSILLTWLSLEIVGVSVYARTNALDQLGVGTSTWLQGGLIKTNRLFDLAIQGPGFFLLKSPEGKLFATRDGSMSLTSDGYLVYRDTSYVLQSLDGSNLRIDPSAKVQKTWNVSNEGDIGAINTNGRQTVFGQVGLVIVRNLGALLHVRNALYQIPANSPLNLGRPMTDGRGLILSGYLEEASELTNLLRKNQFDRPPQRSFGIVKLRMACRIYDGLDVIFIDRTRAIAPSNGANQWWDFSSHDDYQLFGSYDQSFRYIIWSSEQKCGPFEGEIAFNLLSKQRITFQDKVCNGWCTFEKSQ